MIKIYINTTDATKEEIDYLFYVWEAGIESGAVR